MALDRDVAVVTHTHRTDIDGSRSESERRSDGSRRWRGNFQPGAGSATDEGRDRSGEVERIDRLRQERLEAKLLQPGGSVALPMRGDRNRGDAAALLVLELADLLKQPEAILARHRQIRDHRVHSYRLKNGQRVSGRPRRQDVRPEESQSGTEELERIDVIIHDQDVDVGQIYRTNLGCRAGHAGRMRNIGTNSVTDVIFDT